MTKTQRWKRLAELGHSAASVADDLGVHRASVSRVLNGDSVSHDICHAIARLFGMSVAQVFPRVSAADLRIAERRANARRAAA